MKTPEKIKKGLRCRIKGCKGQCDNDCKNCDVYVMAYPFPEVYEDALSYIQQLEQERDALIAALKRTDVDCEYCKHAMQNNKHCEEADGICERCDLAESCRCITCTRMNSNWEWCGVKHE